MSVRKLLAQIFGLSTSGKDTEDAKPIQGGDRLSDEERKLIRERVERSFGRGFRRGANRFE